MLFYEEYNDETNSFRNFEYTDEDIEAIFDNVKDVRNIDDFNVNWGEVEMDRMYYHISKQKAKRKGKSQLKKLYEDIKHILVNNGPRS